MNALVWIIKEVAETDCACVVCWIRVMHLLYAVSTLKSSGRNISKLKKNPLLLVFQVNLPSATDISPPPATFLRLIVRIWFSPKKGPTLVQTSVLVMGVLCSRDVRCRRGIKSLTVINCSHCIRCRLQMFTYVPAVKINGRNKLFSKCWSKYDVKSKESTLELFAAG